jgi:2-polyprenyl-3-methyl-5-hydroxy-6-metoxy-1,4-benzoquinol methylase
LGYLETSLELIEKVAAERSASIIDVGGGESTLVDDLLVRGYQNLTVLDVSQTAIDPTKKRLGSGRVRWLVANILEVELEPFAYDVWHDRAVFHFSRGRSSASPNVEQVTRAVKPSGHVIVSTF